MCRVGRLLSLALALFGQGLYMGTTAASERVSCATNSSRGEGFCVGVLAGEAAAIGFLRLVAEAQRPKWTLEVFAVAERSLPPQKRAPTTRRVLDVLLVVLPSSGNGTAVWLQDIGKLAPTLPVLVLGQGASAERSIEWLLAGARGFLAQPVASEDLSRALREVVAGHPVLCPEAQHSIVSWLNDVGTATRLAAHADPERRGPADMARQALSAAGIRSTGPGCLHRPPG